MMVINTHLTPFPEAYLMGMHQMRQMASAIAEEDDEVILVVGGDMNAGLYYAQDVWLRPDGGTTGDWFANALAVPLAFAYADLRDLVVEGRSEQDIVLDVELADSMRTHPALSKALPFGVADSCEAEAHVFTATDCNPLYFLNTQVPKRPLAWTIFGYVTSTNECTWWRAA
ncbi:MAG: hypothetical protein GY822_03670 [Deltaproteobacteria bacterium]|nr:hypothetical protein [Deltaproteobacteria bacterium]